jgi:hypothetical protein
MSTGTCMPSPGHKMLELFDSGPQGNSVLYKIFGKRRKYFESHRGTIVRYQHANEVTLTYEKTRVVFDDLAVNPTNSSNVKQSNVIIYVGFI